MCTWSSVEGVSGVIQATCSTLAGLPLADVMYIGGMAKNLTATRDALRAAGLITAVPMPEAVSNFMIRLGFLMGSLPVKLS